MTRKAFWLTKTLAAALTLTLPSNVMAGCLQGVVRSSANHPLPGAIVVVVETGDRGRTNADGQYYLPNIAAGKATLAAAGNGYLPALALVTVKEDGTTTQGFTLKADAAAQRKSIESPKTIITSGEQPPVVTESGPVEEGWQIIAKSDKSDKSVYLPGEPIVVVVSVKNVSQKDQDIRDSVFDCDFEFVVTCDGAETPLTSYGAQSRRQRQDLLKGELTGYSRPGLTFGPLHPGQAKTYQLVVNRFQDMTLDGTYTIVIKRVTSTQAQLVAAPVQVEVRSAGVQ